MIGTFLNIGLHLAGMTDDDVAELEKAQPHAARIIRALKELQPIMEELLPLTERAEPIIRDILPDIKAVIPTADMLIALLRD
jgi:hypothetical protein